MNIRTPLGILAGFVSWWAAFFAIAGSYVLLVPGFSEAGRLAQDDNNWSLFTTPMLLLMILMYFFVNPLAGWLTVFITQNRNHAWITVIPLVLYAAHAHLYRLWNILPDWYNVAVVVLIPPLVYLGSRLTKLKPA